MERRHGILGCLVVKAQWATKYLNFLHKICRNDIVGAPQNLVAQIKATCFRHFHALILLLITFFCFPPNFILFVLYTTKKNVSPNHVRLLLFRVIKCLTDRYTTKIVAFNYIQIFYLNKYEFPNDVDRKVIQKSKLEIVDRIYPIILLVQMNLNF